MSFNIDAVLHNIPLNIDPYDDELLDKYIDYTDLEKKYAFTTADKFSCIVVIDGLPIIPASKAPKLLTVLIGLFAKAGFEFEADAFHLPFSAPDESGDAKSQGFMFLYCESPEVANQFIKKAQLTRLDKQHVLLLNKFVDIEHYAEVPKNWNELSMVGPEPEFKPRPSLHSWLLDSEVRNQFAFYSRDSILFMWNNLTEKPTEWRVINKHPDTYISWSPRGSYFATAHEEGIALFAGPDLNPYARFMHPSVMLFDFSPCENYLITYSSDPLPAPSATKPWGIESKGHCFIIWEIFSGQIMRSFPLDISSSSASSSSSSSSSNYNTNISWPFFKWSCDDRFFAAICDKTNRLAVYETPSMCQVDKSFYQNITNVQSFDWVPCTPDGTDPTTLTDAPLSVASGKTGSKSKKNDYVSSSNIAGAPTHTLAYFCPAVGNDRPAQIVMLNAATRQYLSRRQMFYACSASIKFSKSCDYLLFRIVRTNKSGKSTYSSLEVCYLREKDYPFDSIDFKIPLAAAEISPCGNHLAAICWDGFIGTNLNEHNVDISAVSEGLSGRMIIGFYEIAKDGSARMSNSKSKVSIKRHVPGASAMGGSSSLSTSSGAASCSASVVPPIQPSPSGVVLPSTNNVRLLRQFAERSLNALYWAPGGRFVVAAGLKNHGKLEFYDVEPNKGYNAISKSTHEVNGESYLTNRLLDPVTMLYSHDHHGVNHVEWDPSGRSVSSMAFSSSKNHDPGYVMWTFNGKIQEKANLVDLKQFIWRPQPPTRLSRKRTENIIKNIKSYIRGNFEKDRELKEAKEAKELEKKKNLFKEFLKLRSAGLLCLDFISQRESPYYGQNR